MYNLTLTSGERLAIDFVGNRYEHGDELYRMLSCVDCPARIEDDWDSTGDFTFYFQEHEAWEFRANYYGSAFELFADSLRVKLNDFMDLIV